MLLLMLPLCVQQPCLLLGRLTYEHYDQADIPVVSDDGSMGNQPLRNQVLLCNEKKLIRVKKFKPIAFENPSAFQFATSMQLQFSTS